MNRTKSFAMLLPLLAGLTLAQATTPAQVSELIARGEYRAAAQAGTALNTPEGFVLAAQATSYLAASLPDAQRVAAYEQARQLASRAIQGAPNNAQAYFERARATGRVAQTRGILESLGLAREMRADLERAISLNNAMGSAYVALGLWHAELVGKGLIASSATGASAAQVRPNFERAVSLDAQNPTYRLEYGRALMAMAGRNNNVRNEARAQLQRAVALSPRSAAERADVEAAQELLRNWR